VSERERGRGSERESDGHYTNHFTHQSISRLVFVDAVAVVAACS
jgi:hypothetical protein